MLYSKIFDEKSGLINFFKQSDEEIIINLSQGQQPKLIEILSYYEDVLKMRYDRGIPLSVKITFGVLKYLLKKSFLYTEVKQMQDFDSFKSMLLAKYSMKIFKLVGQIVD
jgi:hypothetical protein